MSGIVALFDRGRGRIEREEIRAMTESISHRGPDGSGWWCDDGVALGHQQLHTVPEPQTVEQPYSMDGVTAVGDIRIDNRTALIDRLQISDSPEQVSDTRLLLGAYRKWGSDLLEQLVGSFAFAIWDADCKTLLCARDRFGVKPLYVYRGDDVIAIASEIKAIRSLPFVPVQIDETRVGDFLCGMHDGERTFFQHVKRVPSAHAMRFAANGTDSWRFWRLDPSRTIDLGSDTAYERRFRELFAQAVRCRLRTDGPVGSTLSGGIDSSSVTVMARELLPQHTPLHTFSNMFAKAPSTDESEYIDTVASMGGIVPHQVWCDDTGVLTSGDIFSHLDEPPSNDLDFSLWELFKCAGQQETDVVLFGTMGDEAIGHGLRLFVDLLVRGRWYKLYEELRETSDNWNRPTGEFFRANTIHPIIPDSVLRVRRRMKNEPVSLERANPLLNPEFVDRRNLDTRFETRELKTFGLHRNDRYDQCSALESENIPAVFETTDMYAAAFGVEPRYPFTDKRLVEFALAIPTTQKLKNGYTRSIIRRAIGDILPDKIQWRPGKTFMNEAFQNALLDETDRFESLFDSPNPIDKYLSVEDLRDVYDQFAQEQDQVDAKLLWKALSLWAWFQQTPVPRE